MVDAKKITDEQVGLLLSREEGHFIDFKAKEIKPAKLSQTLSALANADGGEVYVGVSEDKQKERFFWEGFNKIEDANAHISLIQTLFPFGTHCSSQFLHADSSNGYVLHINVEKTSDIKKTSDDKVYIRRGAQNIILNNQESIERLELDKGIQTYEDKSIATQIENITNSIPIIDFMLEIVPTAEPEEWLRKQQLISNDKILVAAILLFAEEPQIWLPKASIKIYRYDTDELEGTRETLSEDPITIEGPIYNQIKEAVSTVADRIQKIRAYRSDKLVLINYPTEAIHEIITNAVIHRDYSIDDNVHIIIFNNRIEIKSPGRLPGHVTEKNILKTRASRNHKLQRYLNKFPDPPNKDVGEGLNTAFNAMRDLHLKAPQISQDSNSVTVYLYHEKLAGHEETVLQYLEKNESIGNAKIREICNLKSESVARKMMQKLSEAGEVEHVPGTRGRGHAYRRQRPKSTPERSS